jgi:citrate synthase
MVNDASATIGKQELLDDMQSTDGFDNLDEERCQRLLDDQESVYLELQKIFSNAGDEGEMILDGELEKKIAHIYEEKEAASRLKKKGNAQRHAEVEQEAAAAEARPLAEEQEQQLGSVVSTIKRRGAQVLRYLDSLLSGKDRTAENINKKNDATQIKRLQAFLKEDKPYQPPRSNGKKKKDWNS